MELLKNTLKNIKGLDAETMEQARLYQDRLTKPLGSLGRLEEVAIKFCAIRGELHPEVKGKRVVVFAADHGVTAEGVSAYPQEVTAQMVYNFLRGGAGINAIASVSGASVEVVDMGVNHDFAKMEGLIDKKVRKGTGNFAKGPAMSLEELYQAMEAGIEIAHRAAEQGVNLIAAGDMGIGNTTSASALYSAYLGISPESVVGPGTGIGLEKIKAKAMVVTRALQKNENALGDAYGTLAALGGFEIAGIAGLYLGACEKRMVVLVDGFIASSAALAAMRICPVVAELLIFSHLSEEPGHSRILKAMNVKPLLSLNLRLGEGTGACLSMPLVEAALACHNKMATFASAGVSGKE